MEHLTASQNSFGSLDFGIWILFGICHLVLVILHILRLNYHLGKMYNISN